MHTEDPEEMGVDDETETTNLFIDLHRIRDWCEDYRFSSHFLIRKEYMEFEKYLDEGKAQKVLLTDQPGIGASIVSGNPEMITANLHLREDVLPDVPH